MELLGITWNAINHLIWFPVVLVAIITILYQLRKRQHAISLLASSMFAKLLGNTSPGKQLLKTILYSIGFIFLFLAFLDPQWSKTEETVAQEGRDLFIALDISRSMLATDCQPSRLACAKKKIKQLLAQLKCERVGLILFSGEAFVQCPLTTDYGAFMMYLDQVDAELISSGTTALDKAINQAIIAFKSLPDRKNKLVVLFTDGEDFSHNLAGIKRRAQKEGLSLFTFGVGTVEGAPVPLFDTHGKQIGHQKDAKGNVVISHLNEGILQTLAQDVGGTYLNMKQNNSDLRLLVHQVEQFEKEQLEDRAYSRLEHQYPYFLLVSLICLAFEWLL